MLAQITTLKGLQSYIDALSRRSGPGLVQAGVQPRAGPRA